MPMIRHSQSQKDTISLEKPFMHPKHCMKIAVCNLHALNDTAKVAKLTKEMDRYGVDVLGVAKCRYTGSNLIRIEDKLVIYSCAKYDLHYQDILTLPR